MRIEATVETSGRDLARAEESDEAEVIRELYLEVVRSTEKGAPPSLDEVKRSHSAREALQRKQPMSTPYLRALAQKGEW